MTTVYRYLFPAMWFGWAAYWWVSSRNVKPALQHESVSSRLSYAIPLALAGLLLSLRNLPVPALQKRFLPFAAWPFVLAAVLTAAGLLFSVWARRYLGTNWSGAVTIKEGHELITSGPYALVRHPIYTGLLLAILGSAMAIGEWRAVLAMALASLALWRKLRLEERWMLYQFGEAYQTYRRKVPALIPFLLWASA
ncbi:MAG TPA: isoprenylcysteine carboxylmethyltransferase family protein [Candidatus Binatia bacterium]